MIATTTRPFRQARHPLRVGPTRRAGAFAMLARLSSGTVILVAGRLPRRSRQDADRMPLGPHLAEIRAHPRGPRF